jgi:hypothetical protein
METELDNERAELTAVPANQYAYWVSLSPATSRGSIRTAVPGTIGNV